jgi:hypothetical protein
MENRDNNNLGNQSSNNNNLNSDLTKAVDRNYESITGKSCTVLDMARESVVDPGKIDEIVEEAMEKYEGLEEKISDLVDSGNISDKKKILDLQKEACDTLTKSVTQVDKIYRSEFLSGANMPEEGDQYDRKMRELEHDTSLRSDMVNKQTRYLEEQIKNQELGENSSEKPQVTGSLVDDYADVSLEPGD